MNPFWQRVGGYTLQRLGEPTTWAGITIIVTGVTGVTVQPELQAAIVSFGSGIAGILLMAAREGRNKPDNPSLPTACKGEMPQPKPAIVPPSTDGMKPVSKSDQLEADPAGVVHVEGQKPTSEQQP